MDLSTLDYLALGGAAGLAGAINAVAGGGTLITFPVMTAVGVPAVRANATSTVALLPGHFGGARAQRADLDTLEADVRTPVIVSVIGGLAGSILLVFTSEDLFRMIVPYLIIFACLLLAVQNPLRKMLFSRRRSDHRVAEMAAIGAAAVYGGYFGAGLGIVIIAVLGLFSDAPLPKVNALKSLLAVSVNISAAAFLALSGKVEWTVVAVMAPMSLLGGHLGGRTVSHLDPTLLRTTIVVYGLFVAGVYLLR
jgi:uncharacterized protein